MAVWLRRRCVGIAWRDGGGCGGLGEEEPADMLRQCCDNVATVLCHTTPLSNSRVAMDRGWRRDLLYGLVSERFPPSNTRLLCAQVRCVIKNPPVCTCATWYLVTAAASKVPAGRCGRGDASCCPRFAWAEVMPLTGGSGLELPKHPPQHAVWKPPKTVFWHA